MAQFLTFSDPSVPSNPVYWVAAFKQFGSFQDNVVGPGVTITYGLKETGNYPGDVSWPARVLSPAEKGQIQDAMDKISQVCGITFVQGDPATAELLFAATSATTDAVGRTFHGVGAQTETWARDTQNSTVGNNSYIYKHEILHALGLDHSTTFFGGADPNLPDSQAVGTTLFGDWQGGFQNDYELFDIAALQYLYGPPQLRIGNDTYTLNPAAFDPLSPQIGWPLLWDGGGFDTLDYSAFAVPLNISLEPGVLNRINGAAGSILEGGVFSINYHTVIEALIGGSQNDVLTGNGADNTLTGGDGNDTLTGGPGTDTLIGGLGNDTYVLENGVDAVSDIGGIDTVTSTISRSLAAGGLVNVENLTLLNVSTAVAGAGNALGNVITGNNFSNALSGNAGNDRLVGGAGNDTLTGGLGADVLIGGAGNDTYVLENGRDTVSDLSGTADRATSTASRSLLVGGLRAVENLTLVGTGTINGTGNNLANVITGNSKANVLDGGAGNDTLNGGLGNDTLIGGLGRDTESGGAGNDTFRFSSVTQSPASSGRDLILDFDDHGNDRVDLSHVYAGVLTYIHDAAFTAAGQVRISDIAGPDVIVEVNTGGSLAADMQIRLGHTTLASMTVGDFIL